MILDFIASNWIYYIGAVWVALIILSSIFNLQIEINNQELGRIVSLITYMIIMPFMLPILAVFVVLAIILGIITIVIILIVLIVGAILSSFN